MPEKLAWGVPVAILLVAILLVAAFARLSGADGEVAADRLQPPTAERGPSRAATGAAALPAPDPAARTPLDEPPARPTPPGSGVTVTVRWADDGRPARGVGVTLRDRSRPVFQLDRLTDDAGRCSFPDVRPGPWSVVGSHTGAQVRIDVVADRVTTVELTAVRRATVRGQVVDADGRPLAGAAVWTSPVLAGGTWRADTRYAVCRTGADGRFTAPLAGAHWIGASVPGLEEPRAVRCDAADGDRNDLRLVAHRPAARLSGTVRDLSGTPLSDARVLVESASEPLPADRSRAEVRRSATTAGDGSFAFDGLAPGVVTLRVWSPGFAAHRSELAVERAAPRTVDVVLVRGATVQGTVRDADGHPIAGAAIAAPGLDAPEFEVSTVTDPDGRFRLGDLPAGSTELACVEIEQGRTTRAVLALTAGGTATWDPVLRDTATVTGVVLGPDGRPLAGAWVSSSPDADTRPRNYVTTDAGGRFELRLLAPGTVTVFVGAPFATPIATVPEVRSGTRGLVVELDDDAAPTARVRGRVVDADGAPARARVVPRRADGTESDGSARTGADGSFTTPRLRPGRTMLCIGVEGALLPGRVVDLTPGEDLDVGVLEIPRTGALAVSVADLHGRPLPDGVVRIANGEGTWTSTARVTGGAARFEVLAPGEYRITVHGDDGGTAAAVVVVHPERTVERSLGLVRARPVTVEIADRDDHVAGVVFAHAGDGTLVGMAEFGAAQRPCVVRVPHGPVRLEARAWDGRRATAEVEVREDGPVPRARLVLPGR